MTYAIILLWESNVIMTKEELEKQKKELNELIDDYFALSKKDIKNKELLIIKIRKLQDEVDNSYRKLQQQNI